MTYLIGLMSGTSVDGIDAALVDISGTEEDLAIHLIAAETYPYPETLRATIVAVCGGAPVTMAQLAALDDAIAQEFAQAALRLQQGQPTAALIGSHGQTVYHRPPREQGLGYSLQLGRGAVIARQTQTPTVTNFRAADIAAGGQGAPLVSRPDVCLLSHPHNSRCVQNIGGISNLTYLPPRQKASFLGAGVTGWDVGPGNILLDLAVQKLSGGQQRYDDNGAWAATGQPCAALVHQWLQQDFFHQPPPKSTGRELFGPDYLAACLQDAEPYHLSQADLLATLTDFTAAAIAFNYRHFLAELPDEVLVCGGGSHNSYLKQRLQFHLQLPVLTTDAVGLSSDYKEAIAFAVLAYWRQRGLPGNLPTVTGASRAIPLGELSLPEPPDIF
jgi:anhydro-N-acetylmuramic acid kinase